MKTAWELRIRQLDIRLASHADYVALNNFTNLIRAERTPDDPPRSLEETIQQARNIPPVVDLRMWGMEQPEGTEFVAVGSIEIVQLEQNRHAAQFNLDVLPEFRERGLEVSLLRHITEVAEQAGRSLLITSTNSRVPWGEALMQKLGAEKALESHTNQLVLRELDQHLVKSWLEQGQEKAVEFELLFWEGAYPQEHLTAFAALMDVMNTAPRGSLQVEDFQLTPELLRQIEQMLFAAGNERWTLVVREKASGQLAGYTEITWHKGRPQIINQQGTGVLTEFRNKGLGRWLKAAMLDKLLHERPEARFVRTGNADANAPMLKINQALGFQPYIAQATWQIETTRVRAWLEGEPK
ncbi:GNAT family N-acetyltransferase [Meiothermus hypogaeus]|uniref:GNAT family N-acetyltransferase n=2 Tax=Meiothermus hypogaeus TaxID=884155 RepID=A0A511R3E6_9DEIN|nr:hypothetical protein [Meiothermus hypogaeus]RIH78540.1 Acetyltransferase (GNAT) family protein [Meiothermus hypogaeus]GEM84151.1 GNAT family N-acetyltransferase [Meiothermus hypogaeus NBRC 106114]